MAPEENKLLIRRLFEDVINTGEVERADELVADDFVEHNPAPGQGSGLEGFKQVVAMLHSAFPDLVITIDELIAEGDLVSVRLTARGTHGAPFQGIQPTGKRVEWGGISMIRIAGNKVVERWFHADSLGLMRQIGAIPAPGVRPADSGGQP